MISSFLSRIIFIVVNFSSLSIYAQETLVNGFIVNNENSIIKGQLDYQEWKNSPEKIRFKANNKNDFSLYTSKDIKKAGTQDSTIIFTSAEVEIEVSPSTTNDLNDFSTFKIDKKHVFLKKLIGGEKDLYEYKNYGKPNFYFYSKGKYNLLLYKKYLSKENGNRKISEKKNYLGQLLYYLGNAPGLNYKISKTDYSQEDLISLFKYYYKNSKYSITYEYVEPDIKLFTQKIYLGVSLSNISFNSNEKVYNHLTKGNFTPSLNLAIGFGLSYRFKDKYKNLSNVNEIFINNYNFQDSYYEESNPEVYSDINTQLGFTYLKMNNLISYHFPNSSPDYGFFINAGLSTGFIIISRNFKGTETRFYSSNRYYRGNAIPSTRKLESGLILSFGTEYRNFSFELRHEISNGMSNIISLGSTVNRTFFLVAYSFK